jgi:hypothetical protein
MARSFTARKISTTLGRRICRAVGDARSKLGLDEARPPGELGRDAGDGWRAARRFDFTLTCAAGNTPGSTTLRWRRFQERTRTCKDMIEVSKFLEFIVTYEPALEP